MIVLSLSSCMGGLEEGGEDGFEFTEEEVAAGEGFDFSEEEAIDISAQKGMDFSDDEGLELV